ncbi:hypothetical protein [uncultured Neglectibacter sp.]|uniref:hypothetical protein n=1 Tax=uncultured Neglectibacter sp. TaxID=1924108 RepID=UPI0034DE672B
MSEKSPNIDLTLYTNADAPKKFGVWLEEMAGAAPTSNMMKIDAAFSQIESDLSLKADLEDGKIPAGQLPAFVDDVLEFDSAAQFPNKGESGKIYVATSTNLTYRWSGSSYVEISPSLALGETSATAYRGDRGKIAYAHSQTSGNPHGTTAAQVGARPDTWVPTPEEVGADPEGSADAVQSNLNTHKGNSTIHITSSERNAWNGKLNASERGLSGGVAPLDENGKVPKQYLYQQSGFVAQETEPDNTGLLWIDTSVANGVIKYFNGTDWVAVSGVWS